MTSTIYLVRHAESAHSISKDFSHRDPPLTDLGRKQASALVQSLPKPASVAMVFTSPLTRTLETTLAAFSQSLWEMQASKGVPVSFSNPTYKNGGMSPAMPALTTLRLRRDF